MLRLTPQGSKLEHSTSAHTVFRVADAAALCVGLMFWIGGALAAQPQPPDVEESIAVVEASALVEFPRLDLKKAQNLVPADFVVEEDGLQRTVTGVMPLGPDGEPWTVLVYFDPLLAGPSTISLAATALAERATTLVDLGSVRVVTSAPQTQEWIAPTRSAEDLAKALRAIAESQIGRDGLATLRKAQGEAPEDLLAEESFFLRERTDALLLEAADGCPAAPCLLLLVSEGFDTFPESVYPAEAVTKAQPQHKQIATEAEELLAGLGWTVLSLPLVAPGERDTVLGREADLGTDYFAWKEASGGVQMARPQKKGNRLSGVPANALDVFINARLQTLRRWSAASVGAALRLPEQLDAELARLPRRVRVTYRTDLEGASVRRLDLRLAEISPFQESRQVKESLGFVPEDEPLRAPRFAVAGVPVALSDVRARSLAFGKRLTGTLHLEQVRSAADTGAVLGVRWEGIGDEQLVRVSVLDSDGELIARFESASGAANHRVQVDPESTGWVLVEDLSRRTWGATEISGGEPLLD